MQMDGLCSQPPGAEAKQSSPPEPHVCNVCLSFCRARHRVPLLGGLRRKAFLAPQRPQALEISLGARLRVNGSTDGAAVRVECPNHPLHRGLFSRFAKHHRHKANEAHGAGNGEPMSNTQKST